MPNGAGLCTFTVRVRVSARTLGHVHTRTRPPRHSAQLFLTGISYRNLNANYFILPKPLLATPACATILHVPRFTFHYGSDYAYATALGVHRPRLRRQPPRRTPECLHTAPQPGAFVEAIPVKNLYLGTFYITEVDRADRSVQHRTTVGTYIFEHNNAL